MFKAHVTLYKVCVEGITAMVGALKNITLLITIKVISYLEKPFDQ